MKEFQVNLTPLEFVTHIYKTVTENGVSCKDPSIFQILKQVPPLNVVYIDVHRWDELGSGARVC